MRSKPFSLAKRGKNDMTNAVEASMKTRKNSSGLETAAQMSFLLVVFSLGFMRPDIRVRGVSITISEPLFLLAGLIWLPALLCGRLKVRFDKVYYLFGLFALGLLLSTIFSENFRQSSFRFLGVIYLIGLAVLAFNLRETPHFFKRVVTVWLAASSIAALIATVTVVFFFFGISNFITEFSLHHYGSLPPGSYPRIQSTFFYPSLLCNYLTISVMMLFAARHLGWIGRVLFTVLLTLFSVTIAFTLTPGIGGVLLAVSVWVWIVDSARRPSITKVVLAGGTFAATFFLLISTFSFISTPTSPYHFLLGDLRIDPSQRLLTWQGALQTFFAHPAFGKGLGLPVAEVLFMAPSGQMQGLTDAHNLLLSVAAQTGLLGVVPLILIGISVLRRSLPFRIEDGEVNVLRVCLGVAFASAFAYQGIVGSFEDSRHLWVLIGLILAISHHPDRPEDIIASN